MPQMKIRLGSCTKNWSRRHSDFMFLRPSSPLLKLILGLGAQAYMEEKLATTVKRDKWREKNYIKGLTLTRKSCEGVSSFPWALLARPDLTPSFLKISDFWPRNTKTLLTDPVPFSVLVCCLELHLIFSVGRGALWTAFHHDFVSRSFCVASYGIRTLFVEWTHFSHLTSCSINVY
jgi:hypothetical protein